MHIQENPEAFTPAELRKEIANLRRLEKRYGHHDLRLLVIVRLTNALATKLAAG